MSKLPIHRFPIQLLRFAWNLVPHRCLVALDTSSLDRLQHACPRKRSFQQPISTPAQYSSTDWFKKTIYLQNTVQFACTTIQEVYQCVHPLNMFKSDLTGSKITKIDVVYTPGRLVRPVHSKYIGIGNKVWSQGDCAQVVWKYFFTQKNWLLGINRVLSLQLAALSCHVYYEGFAPQNSFI